MKILLAEDTLDLNRAETAVLTTQGYTVDSAYDGEEALELIEKNGYDAIILDIMMPKKDGMQVLQELRARNIMTPVLMLTAKAEVDDRVEGLDAGADDYLTKPFAMKELIARVKAMTRRRTQYSVQELSCGDVTLKAESQELTAENTVRLSVREVELMQALILNKDRSLSTEYLIEHVWSDENELPEDEESRKDTVWLYVNYLKGKLAYINSDLDIEGERGGSFRIVVKQ
ncbi:MAG: response regulator transcription factor [Eubacteriales bacterium]|jgi:DNA-binding response OmpR family regulator